MKKSRIPRTNSNNFLAGKGFYIALAISLIAIGGAAWIGVNSSINKLGDNTLDNDNATSQVENNQDNWNVPTEEEVNKPQSNVPAPKTEDETVKANEPVEQGFIMPLKGEVLNAFSGDKVVKSKTLDEWVMHTGIDISAKLSTPVKAVSNGKVIEVKNDPMWGACVIIEHANGIESHYYNLKSAVNVKKNQQVKLGDVIGAVGNTAEIEQAEESHLHFAMKNKGNWVDPMSIIKN